ncbi:hypothetical protein M4578_14825 [Salipiger sp. P9]|uniref:hypothetical protein n=1 Tax=Salipiger pentaromativorans TaxID=2943193 RepID=UPI0021583FA0|nr:hypothetical protein [Salipiger pentaromativorans]MCR8549110.1 hypothetical protein [Salipiger pentaromativorans]
MGDHAGPGGLDGADLALADLAVHTWPSGAHYGEEAEAAQGGAPQGVAAWGLMTGPELRDAVAQASYGDLLFTGRRMGGLSTMKWEGDGSVRNLRNAAVSLGHFVTLEIVEEFEEDFLIGVSEAGKLLLSWRLSPSGELSEIARIGIEQDLGIASSGGMTVTVVNGVPYVILSDADGTSLSALTLGEDGSLSPADHLPGDSDLGHGETASADTPPPAVDTPAVPEHSSDDHGPAAGAFGNASDGQERAESDHIPNLAGDGGAAPVLPQHGPDAPDPTRGPLFDAPESPTHTETPGSPEQPDNGPENPAGGPQGATELLLRLGATPQAADSLTLDNHATAQSLDMLFDEDETDSFQFRTPDERTALPPAPGLLQRLEDGPGMEIFAELTGDLNVWTDAPAPDGTDPMPHDSDPHPDSIGAIPDAELSLLDTGLPDASDLPF